MSWFLIALVLVWIPYLLYRRREKTVLIIDLYQVEVLPEAPTGPPELDLEDWL